MVLRITDLRKQYGLDPTFETEEEALAYQEERQATYDERVAAKVQELKDLYNSDKEKYSKFQNFEEEDWVSYAKVCLKTNTAIITRSSFQGLPSVENNPEIAKWAGFSYVEILQMESDGVLIPKEVLAWAHSMQDSDVTAYEINDDPNAAAEIEETGTNSENSEFKELQKKTQTLSNKSETNQAQINQNFEAFKELAEKAEQIKQEQETTKKDSLKQIEELTKEWEEISAKIKKGDKLTEAEQKRYKELGSMLNGKDGELVTDIQASSDDLQALIDSMDGLNDEITTNIDLGDDTVEAAKQLSRYEKGYTRKTNAKNEIIDVTTGDIRNALQGSEGKDIAQDALKIGTNLIEFSNTLSTQLMMNQYASLYDFAEIFTQTSTETISNTKEVLGDDFNKTTEELNEQIDALPDMTNAEKDRANLDEKGVGIIAHILEMGAQPAAREPAYIAAEGAAAPHAEHVRGLALPQGGLGYVGVAEALGSPHPAQHERVGRQFDAAWRYKVVIKQYAEDRQRGQQHYDERHKYKRLDEHHVPAWHEHRHEQHPNAHRHAAHGAALAYFVDIVITHVSHNPRFCHKVNKNQPQHWQIQEQNGLSPCFFIQTQYNAPLQARTVPRQSPCGSSHQRFFGIITQQFWN